MRPRRALGLSSSRSPPSTSRRTTSCPRRRRTEAMRPSRRPSTAPSRCRCVRGSRARRPPPHLCVALRRPLLLPHQARRGVASRTLAIFSRLCVAPVERLEEPRLPPRPHVDVRPRFRWSVLRWKSRTSCSAARRDGRSPARRRVRGRSSRVSRGGYPPGLATSEA